MYNWDKLSCDTLAVAKDASAYGSNMFAKNSDRPIGECQPLIWIPGAHHEKGERLDGTGTIIPQAEYTYGVLGSKPYWIWGFEMGLNEKGVIIGNEAENSKDRNLEKHDGLLGMDLLRLGLERGATAKEALQVIVSLLEEYGQNHNANALFDARYENSYIIMDEKEIWILETAGRRWVAKLVKTGMFNIGNCYSVETVFDLASPDLESHARKNRWLFPDETFNFAKAYMANIPAQTLAIPRWRRVNQLAHQYEKHTFESLKRIFRDHYEDDPILKPRYGAASGYFPTVCRHALTWEASQTGASMLAYYRDGLCPVVRNAFCQPCCSIYLPVYPGIKLPELMTKGEGKFDSESLWWLTDRLDKLIGMDEARFSPVAHQKLYALENKINKKAEDAEKKAIKLIAGGKKKEAQELLSDLMVNSAMEAKKLLVSLIEDFQAAISELGVDKIQGTRIDFLKKYCDITEMNLV